MFRNKFEFILNINTNIFIYEYKNLLHFIRFDLIRMVMLTDTTTYININEITQTAPNSIIFKLDHGKNRNDI